MSRRRERRIHEHDRRTNGRVEVIVDMSCIVPGDRDAREQMLEQGGSRVGELVQDEACACKLGMNREEPGPGRGLEHEIGGRNGCGKTRYESEPDWCRELLELLGLPSERRVAEGMSVATLASMASNADGEAARSRIVHPNLRRNRSCAASQASYAVFQVQAPSESELPNAAPIAARSVDGSMMRPRSRSVRSNWAAARRLAPMSDGDAVAGATEREGAITAVEAGKEFMSEIQESEDGTSRGALSRPRRLNPFRPSSPSHVGTECPVPGPPAFMQRT